MMRTLVVCAYLLSGCKGKPPDTKATPGSAATTSADPWAKVGADAGADTPEARKQRADAALGRVSEIKPKLSHLRGLEFKQDVPTGYQTTEEFRAFVQKEIAAELPPERSRNLSAAAFHIGLLAKSVDLAQVSEQAATTQAGAYYDPKAKKFFLVMVPAADMMLDMMSAHELTHGLQDQHFDLASYMPPGLDDDAASARRAIVEGDGTFTMMVYAMGTTTIPPAALGAMRVQLEKMSTMSVTDFKKMTQDQAALFGSMSFDIKSAIDAMDALPSVVLVPMIEAYMKGALVIATAHEQGGWAAVDKLYREPPESTEQILHPTTKLYPVRERPVAVTLTKLADHQELTSNVMGEQLWTIYFKLWKPELAEAAAQGWGGDRYMVVRRKDGRLIGLIATVWDTTEDAKQFANAYAASLAARFPAATTTDVAAGVARPDGGKVFVKTVGARVYIVDGADDPKLLDELIKTSKFRTIARGRP